jgi:hypothetical protein
MSEASARDLGAACPMPAPRSGPRGAAPAPEPTQDAADRPDRHQQVRVDLACQQRAGRRGSLRGRRGWRCAAPGRGRPGTPRPGGRSPRSRPRCWPSGWRRAGAARRSGPAGPGAGRSMRHSMAELWGVHPLCGQSDRPRTRRRPAFAMVIGVVEPPAESNRRPHPYHGTTGNRCADARFPRSCATVRAKVMGSLFVQLCVLLLQTN